VLVLGVLGLLLLTIHLLWSGKPAPDATPTAALPEAAVDGRSDAASESAARANAEVTASTLPLVAGLTIVTAVQHGDGDYESIKRIERVDGAGYALQYSADLPAAAGRDAVTDIVGSLFGASARPAKDDPRRARQVRTRRVVLGNDAQQARMYLQHFAESLPESVPGTTALGVSHAVLNELKNEGAAKLGMADVGPFGGIGTGVSNMIESMSGELSGAVDTSALRAMDRIEGRLERISPVPESFSVLLNDKPATLKAIRARGAMGGQQVELVLLDDPANPLALAWQVGDSAQLRVVRIQMPTRTASTLADVERQLAAAGRVAVYGILFDFDSAILKPESEDVLAEIADMLRRRPDWSLSIEGHTDALGDDAFNLRLSERRAAAVRRALAEVHGIDAQRLAVAGHGESRPTASNQTLEGRARNRRVELLRNDADSPRRH
jgi:outer membrane protein OmpA-like peptidoglycan-associated protein